ncbi:MAG: hypothetical protein R3345_11445 [Fulvivirga sp.]|nr:hypothetical protein [Fulvivirga sp.]
MLDINNYQKMNVLRWAIVVLVLACIGMVFYTLYGSHIAWVEVVGFYVPAFLIFFIMGILNPTFVKINIKGDHIYLETKSLFRPGTRFYETISKNDLIDYKVLRQDSLFKSRLHVFYMKNGLKKQVMIPLTNFSEQNKKRLLNYLQEVCNS